MQINPKRKTNKPPFNPKINYMGSNYLPIKFFRKLFNNVDINYSAYLHDGDFGNLNNRFKQSNVQFLERILQENQRVKDNHKNKYKYYCKYTSSYKPVFKYINHAGGLYTGYYLNIVIAYFLYTCVQFGGIFYKLRRFIHEHTKKQTRTY